MSRCERCGATLAESSVPGTYFAHAAVECLAPLAESLKWANDRIAWLEAELIRVAAGRSIR